jgi:hypothetical protein
MKKMMGDMMDMMKGMRATAQSAPAPAAEAAPASVAEAKGKEIEKPPRVKESQATPNAGQSSFFNEVKKLVR